MFESPSPELQELGMSAFFQQQLHSLSADGAVGRVACERRGEYEVMSARGLLRASLSGRLEHSLPDDDWPTVGDWVVVAPAEPVGRIHHDLERQMHQQGRVDVRLRLAKLREHKIRTRATRSHIKQKGGG